ncbi:uncharacterized protein LOC141908251 [Tubulanus polymorphus]|uniref:uncharacterized protein LOC141908251 n=1 Tax=Tubulanus polymorphus TaxID=672921 RepID=UPI003DA2F733
MEKIIPLSATVNMATSIVHISAGLDSEIDDCSLADRSRDSLVREVIWLRQKLRDTNTGLAKAKDKLKRNKRKSKKLILAWRLRVDEMHRQMSIAKQQHDEQMRDIVSNLLLFESKLRKDQSSITELLDEKDQFISTQQIKLRELRSANESLNERLQKYRRILRVNSSNVDSLRNDSDSVFFSDDDDSNAADESGEKMHNRSKSCDSTSSTEGRPPKAPPRRRRSGLTMTTTEQQHRQKKTSFDDQYRHFPFYSVGDLRQAIEIKEPLELPVRAVSTSDLHKGAWTNDDQDEEADRVNAANNNLNVKSRSAESVVAAATTRDVEEENDDYAEEIHDFVSELNPQFHQRSGSNSSSNNNYPPMTSHKKVQKPRDIKMRDRWRSRSLPQTVNTSYVNGEILPLPPGGSTNQRQYHPPVQL